MLKNKPYGIQEEEIQSSLSDDDKGTPSPLQEPVNPGQEILKVGDTENLKVALIRNPVARWDGRDMDSLLEQIPLSRMGQLRY